MSKGSIWVVEVFKATEKMLCKWYLGVCLKEILSSEILLNKKCEYVWGEGCWAFISTRYELFILTYKYVQSPCLTAWTGNLGQTQNPI